MTIESLTPMLRTWDLKGTIDFYCNRLGFTCIDHDATRNWASLTFGAATVMLAAPNHHEDDVEPKFTGSLYFRVSDVDALWLKTKERARVCYALETFDYGMREFAVYDNNGYLLQFGQEVH